MPTEGPLDLISLFVKLPVEPSKLSGNDELSFGVAAIGINDRRKSRGWNDIFVVNRIKPRIQGEGFTHEWKVHLGGECHQSCQGLGENDTVIAVLRFDTDGAKDEAVIFVSGELLLPFLVLVPRRPEVIPPFLATVLEPSP